MVNNAVVVVVVVVVVGLTFSFFGCLIICSGQHPMFYDRPAGVNMKRIKELGITDADLCYHYVWITGEWGVGCWVLSLLLSLLPMCVFFFFSTRF